MVPGRLSACPDTLSEGTNVASSIVVRPDGRVDVAARGPGSTLIYHWAAPGAGWRSTQIAAEGAAISAPSIFLHADGRTDIVAQAQGNTIMHYRAASGSGWVTAQIAGPGTAYSTPSMSVRPAREAD